MSAPQFSVMLAINGVGLIVVSQIVALLVEKLVVKIINLFNDCANCRRNITYCDVSFTSSFICITHRIFINISPVTSIAPLGFSMAMEERTGGSGNASSLLGLFHLY